MRNEIFQRIKQNRNKYYSELKNYNESLLNNLNPGPEKNNISNVDVKNPGLQSSMLRNIHISTKNISSSLYCKARYQLFGLASKTRCRLIDIYTGMVNKAAIQSNRLTDGLSGIASQLFEDRYEYGRDTEKNDHIGNTSGNQLKVLDLMSVSGATISLPYEPVKFSLPDRFNDWLNKMHRNIILFLESDGWFEEIESSKRRTITRSHQNNKTINISSSNKNRRLCPFFSILRSCKKRITFNHSRIRQKTQRNAPTLQEDGYMLYTIFARKLKQLTNTLFPAINRFVKL